MSTIRAVFLEKMAVRFEKGEVRGEVQMHAVLVIAWLMRTAYAACGADIPAPRNYIEVNPMSQRRILFAALILTLLATSLQARYRRPDLEKIPVARLVENLEKIAAKNPKEVQVRFNLARAHAMAFALKTDTAQVQKGKEMDGAWFGYEPNHVPFIAKTSDDAAKLKTAQEHLSKAIDRYKKLVKLAPANLP